MFVSPEPSPVNDVALTDPVTIKDPDMIADPVTVSSGFIRGE